MLSARPIARSVATLVAGVMCWKGEGFKKSLIIATFGA